MPFHHLALVTRDAPAVHVFYTEAMGFELVKVQIVPKGESFARHVFYTTGSARDQMIAFWDLSRVSDPEALRTDICRDLGLAPGTNHLAFSASDVPDLLRRKERWLACGHDVLEIDHGWIHSIYTEDPDGITVEFAVLTQDFTERDAAEALELLRAEHPAPSERPRKIELHKASARAGA